MALGNGKVCSTWCQDLLKSKQAQVWYFGYSLASQQVQHVRLREFAWGWNSAVSPCAVALDVHQSVYVWHQEHLAWSSRREMQVVPGHGIHVIAATACEGWTKARAGSTAAYFEQEPLVSWSLLASRWIRLITELSALWGRAGREVWWPRHMQDWCFHHSGSRRNSCPILSLAQGQQRTKFNPEI